MKSWSSYALTLERPASAPSVEELEEEVQSAEGQTAEKRDHTVHQ
jgi:hypothetical protein